MFTSFNHDDVIDLFHPHVGVVFCCSEAFFLSAGTRVQISANPPLMTRSSTAGSTL